MKIKVETMANNQYAIFTPSGSVYYQSYDTIVARVDGVGCAGDITIIDGALDISRTTSKYLYRFLAAYTMLDPAYVHKRDILSLIHNGYINVAEAID